MNEGQCLIIAFRQQFVFLYAFKVWLGEQFNGGEPRVGISTDVTL